MSRQTFIRAGFVLAVDARVFRQLPHHPPDQERTAARRSVAHGKSARTGIRNDGHQTGQVVVTRKPEHAIAISISGLPANARIRTVTNGEYSEVLTATGPAFERTVTVATSARTFFRVEAFTADNRPLVFSNPIYFRPDDPAALSDYRRTMCR